MTADFFCPGPTGQADGASTNLFTDVDIPANDALVVFGPFPCTMPDVAPPAVALAGVESAGLLDDGVLEGGSPFVIEKTIGVVVLNCLVQVDKQISCDGGATWQDQALCSPTRTAPTAAPTTDGTADPGSVPGPQCGTQYLARVCAD